MFHFLDTSYLDDAITLGIIPVVAALCEGSLPVTVQSTFDHVILKSICNIQYVLRATIQRMTLVSIVQNWTHRISQLRILTHWCRLMHICINKLTTIGSDNGLVPVRRQASIWINAGILLIWPLGTSIRILIKMYTFSFNKMHLKISSGKWRPFGLGLKLLKMSITLQHQP